MAAERPEETADLAKLKADIRAYEEMLPELEAHHDGKWVVFYDSEFVNAFDSLNNAAADANKRFGRGPYLIRRVGAPSPTLPASVMFRPLAPERAAG